ncbi:hypothetical protein Y032_0042g546 [Ancylostoma ceylanicum]|nr:hypothetical protein Y032_0042g546 [Ancylostoma ceylanicum]
MHGMAFYLVAGLSKTGSLNGRKCLLKLLARSEALLFLMVEGLRFQAVQLVFPQLLPLRFISVDKNMEKRPFLSTKPHLRNSCAESFLSNMEN